MSIEGIKSGLAKYAEIQRITEPKAPGEIKADTQDGVSFSNAFGNAMREVNSLQTQADSKIEDLVLRKDDTTAHEAMIALEQADVAFQLMNNIRAKIVRAYEEVMRTQV
jgi:flagellar hook-basal body complex protein FliE